VSRKGVLMRTLWMFHRRILVAVIVVGVLACLSAVVLAGSHHRVGVPTGGQPSSATTPNSTARIAPTQTRRLAPTSVGKVPPSAIEQQIDAELAAAEAPGAIAAAKRFTVPAPADSTAYPSVPKADRGDPGTYAIAFATELLDTNFAVESRDALLAWAEHEEAPNTLPGVPASVAGKALVLSLADPDLPGGSPSPVPSAPQWAADAGRGVSQSVTDVAAEVDPDWTQIISQGWEPRDPLMTVEVVTGNLTIATGGAVALPQSFSFTLTLGSAAYARGGYGAVAVADWTLD
jgi:hypothetical protein